MGFSLPLLGAEEHQLVPQHLLFVLKVPGWDVQLSKYAAIPKLPSGNTSAFEYKNISPVK